MLVCAGCKKEMQCIQNGVGIDFGNGHVYPSDTFLCRQCRVVIAYSNSKPTSDKNYDKQATYIRMTKKGE